MNKKIISLMLALLLTAAVFTGCTAQGGESQVLTVGMELAYPPFEMKDEAGEPSGISADFSRAFGEYIGKEVKIENISFDGLIPSLETGKVDMVMSSMTITELRAEAVDFSDPYANAMLAVLAGKDSGISQAEDLNQPGKKVAVKASSTGHIYAQNNLTNAEIIVLADESACVTEVVQGKADGFIYDQLTIYRNQKANADSTVAVFIPFQDVEKWGVAVQKGNSQLVDQLNAFIKKYAEEGGFDQLTETYLAEEKAAFEQLDFKWFFDLQD